MNRIKVLRTIRNSTWLLGGTVMLCAAFVLWVGITIHQNVVKPADDDDDNQPDVPVEPEKVRFSPTLGMMTDIVPELNLKKHETSDEHDPEFKGQDFFDEHANQWTVQIMSVTQEAVIKNYLAKRPDRDQFYYFRYVEKGQPDYYVLTYGAFATVSVAFDALKKVDFELPDSVKVEPKRFHDYRANVVDSNGEQEVTGGTVRGKVYSVSLHQVAIPVETPPTSITNNTNSLTTSTTLRVTRREPEGTASSPEVSISRSINGQVDTSATPPTAPISKPDTTIKDPFN